VVGRPKKDRIAAFFFFPFFFPASPPRLSSHHPFFLLQPATRSRTVTPRRYNNRHGADPCSLPPFLFFFFSFSPPSRACSPFYHVFPPPPHLHPTTWSKTCELLSRQNAGRGSPSLFPLPFPFFSFLSFFPLFALGQTRICEMD